MNRAPLLSGLFLTLVVVLCVSCRGGRVQGETAAETVEPEATVAVEPTAPGSGQVRASLEASCRLLEFGAEVTLTYSARAEGANRLSRVRLLMNGRTEFDSGEISQLELAGNKVVGVNPGGQHDLQLVANSPGTRPTTARSFVRCPRAPAGPRL